MADASSSSSFLLTLTTIDFILSALTVCGNLLLLVTILCDPLRCLRTPTTFLTANLAFSDLLLGLLIGCSSACVQDFMYLNKTVPEWLGALFNIGGGASLVSGICTVIAMAVDRYVAVTDPLHFNERVTKRRVLIFILLSWPISIAPLSFYPFATQQNWAIFLLVYSHTHFTIPIFVLLFVYSRIFRSLIRRRCELVSMATSDSTITLRHTLERERKMAHTTFMILLLFCVSFLPLYIKIQLLTFCKCRNSTSFYKFNCITHTFLYFSSLLDPFIYAWRVPKFRRSLRLCLRFERRNAVRPLTSTSRKWERHTRRK